MVNAETENLDTKFVAKNKCRYISIEDASGKWPTEFSMLNLSHILG